VSTADNSKLIDLPARDPSGHKGTFGTLSIVGGCAGDTSPMIGAPTLAARAAFRSGCGLVRLVMPSPILIPGLQLEPSATGVGLEVDSQGNPSATENILCLIREADAVVVGPGMGSDIPRVHHRTHLVSSCIELGLPCVVDADGLNALVTGGALSKSGLSRCVLTPHPGEFSRLAKERGITADPTDSTERPDAAAALAHSLGCVVVLKGAHTVVSDGDKSWVCSRGHACMATAGTGDVLAGLIGSLIVQMRSPSIPLYEIARLGVQAHAIAGERWSSRTSSESGMLARELADELPMVVTKMR
jgi:hydroxyethylthiazole kinase-like uncharacterized protein yjeF